MAADVRRTGRAIRLALAVIAVCALVVGSIASADAAAAKRHSVKATVTAAGVSEGGGLTTVVGTVTGKPFAGEGAVIYHIATGSTGQVKLKFTAFDRRGSLKGTTLVTITPGPNNTQTFSGSAKVSGGTGLYKHAKGSLKLSGSGDADGILHFTVTGSIRY